MRLRFRSVWMWGRWLLGIVVRPRAIELYAGPLGVTVWKHEVIECAACGRDIEIGEWDRPQQFVSLSKNGYNAPMCGECVFVLGPKQNELLRALSAGATVRDAASSLGVRRTA